LPGLRTWDDSRQIGILAALELTFLPFGGTLGAALLFVLLFLFTQLFPAAFFHHSHASGLGLSSAGGTGSKL
jgi:hypothetical protein